MRRAVPAVGAAQILSYGYLWDKIRVKGGAYGTGLSVQPNGDVRFSSFRDPNAFGSLTIFDSAGAALRGFCDSGTAIDKYIISTVAADDALLTPRMMGNLAAELYFTGRRDADRRRLRGEILNTTREELRTFGEVLDQICAAAGVCVIGGKETLDACGGILDRIEAL